MRERGVVPEVQQIRTSVETKAEKQALLIRTSFPQYSPQYGEKISITYTKVSASNKADITYTIGAVPFTFENTLSPAEIEMIFSSTYTVSVTASSSRDDLVDFFEISFDPSHGNIPDGTVSIVGAFGTISSRIMSQGGMAEVQVIEFATNTGDTEIGFGPQFSRPIALSTTDANVVKHVSFSLSFSGYICPFTMLDMI